jgi:Smr domain
MRTGEALRQLEQFLDQAYLTNQHELRIVHGIGSGALKEAIHNYLSTSHYCAVSDRPNHITAAPGLQSSKSARERISRAPSRAQAGNQMTPSWRRPSRSWSLRPSIFP